VEVAQVVEIPEGGTETTATFLVPQGGPFNAIAIDTSEGGEKIEELTQDLLGWPANVNASWHASEARPAVLLINSRVPPRDERQQVIEAFERNAADSGATALPDVRAFLNVYPDPTTPRSPMSAAATLAPTPLTGKITDAALLSMLALRSRAAIMPPGELPARWIELSQFDTAVVSLEDLAKAKSDHPEQFAALRDWLSTGPLLIAYGCGQNFAKLKELEQELELAPLETAQEGPLLGWKIPAWKDRIGRPRTQFDEVLDPAAAARRTRTVEPTDVNEGLASVDSGDMPPFVFRTAGLGCVVAIAAENPFPGTRADWSWIYNSVPEAHSKWMKRTGASLQRPNPDFWNLLVPGVGRAPIWSYLLLVSLFAVVIGPINYLLLDRVRRLYLLLITVPAGAVVVTLGLIVFAIVSDGVRMRMRARSFTELDQANGRAAMWSRQSYYAAIAPSQGLTFPDDATVFPLVPQPGDRSLPQSALLEWDEGQHLRGGYLTSRTATQFVIARARKSDARLIVRPKKRTSDPVEIENRLEGKIQYVLVRDGERNWLRGEAILDGTVGRLFPTTADEAKLKMKAIADGVKPAPPTGYDPEANRESMFVFLNRRRYRPLNTDSGDRAQTSDSILENRIEVALDPVGTPLAPGSYVAIVEHSPLVVPGAGGVQEEASLHLIHGKF
jgi:hypothetical protein